MFVLAALAVLLGAGVLYQRIDSARQRRRLPPPGRFVEVGGHRLHMICRGTAAPRVMLESGIAASSVSWARAQPAIAEFATVCAYDRAGLAWSDAPSCPRTFTQIVDELAAVLAAWGGRRYVLVGHSFGSLIVRGYAARYADRVAGLVLVDPPTDWLEPNPERSRLLRGAGHLSRIGAGLAHVGIVRACLALLTGGQPGPPRRVARLFGTRALRVLERLVGEVRKLPPEMHAVVQELWSQPKCFNAMADYLAVLDREAASIASVEPPPEIAVTVISGGHQEPGERAAQRRLAERSMRGRHMVAARSGHWILFDEPELIVIAVRDLVQAGD